MNKRTYSQIIFYMSVTVASFLSQKMRVASLAFLNLLIKKQ